MTDSNAAADGGDGGGMSGPGMAPTETDPMIGDMSMDAKDEMMGKQSSSESSSS